MISRKEIGYLVGAVFAPFVIQAILLIGARKIEAATVAPSAVIGTIDYASLVVSTVIGFVFLWQWLRLYSLAIAVIYFPAMYYLLVSFSFAVIFQLYGLAS
jgi:hypothetical protein